MNVTQALGTDIAHVGDLVRTSSGDIGRIVGLANYKNALFHRLITRPGSLVWRPGYGVGVMDYQNALSSFSKQQQLASKIQEQFAQDPRTAEVQSVSVIANDLSPELTVISVSVRPIGYSDFQVMEFQPFTGNL